eukprot:10107410-Lingulodinium_polyedra.AAC.1
MPTLAALWLTRGPFVVKLWIAVSNCCATAAPNQVNADSTIAPWWFAGCLMVALRWLHNRSMV